MIRTNSKVMYYFLQFADFSYQPCASATSDMTRQNTTTHTTSVIFFSPAISPHHIFDKGVCKAMVKENYRLRNLREE
jgi:hypothetical protein